jgi:hypothetical protein
MATTAAIGGYREAAQAKLGALTGVPAGNLTYWKLGNSFDTMIDYLDHVDDGAAVAVARMVARQYGPALDGLGGYGGAWFDDLGWWTVATLRGGSRSYFDARFRGFLGNIRENCRSHFAENAPFVWERRIRSPDRFAGYEPALQGGVWNEYWMGTTGYSGPNDGDPSSGTLKGIQNTVTNTLFLMAAQRLPAPGPAQRELGFLYGWLDASPNPLWWPQNPMGTAALVRERVSHFANGTADSGFEPGWAWTGDQGLVLGAFVDRMQMPDVKPEERGVLLCRSRALLQGVAQSLAVDGVLQPWNDASGVPQDDGSDYETGTGVFWRNVLHAWSTVPELRSTIGALPFQNLLRASADAAAKNGDARDGTALTNDVSVLVAAVVMLS